MSELNNITSQGLRAPWRESSTRYWLRFRVNRGPGSNRKCAINRWRREMRKIEINEREFSAALAAIERSLLDG